ncbi:hypothetical protein SHIRM173S_08832 [Streptomyces hirsutus]
MRLRRAAGGGQRAGSGSSAVASGAFTPRVGVPACRTPLQLQRNPGVLGVDDGELRKRHAQAPPLTWPDVVRERAGSRDARNHRSHLRGRRILRAGDRPRPGGDRLRLARHGPQLGRVPLDPGAGRRGAGRHRHAAGGHLAGRSPPARATECSDHPGGPGPDGRPRFRTDEDPESGQKSPEPHGTGRRASGERRRPFFLCRAPASGVAARRARAGRGHVEQPGSGRWPASARTGRRAPRGPAPSALPPRSTARRCGRTAWRRPARVGEAEAVRAQ